MKRTNSQSKMPTYQKSGKELTIFWDEKVESNLALDGESETFYSYAYCVVSIYADRSTIIESIISCSYPTYGSEFAAMINGGDDLEKHQAERLQAKALADGWLNS